MKVKELIENEIPLEVCLIGAETELYGRIIGFDDENQFITFLTITGKTDVIMFPLSSVQKFKQLTGSEVDYVKTNRRH